MMAPQGDAKRRREPDDEAPLPNEAEIRAHARQMREAFLKDSFPSLEKQKVVTEQCVGQMVTALDPRNLGERQTRCAGLWLVVGSSRSNIARVSRQLQSPGTSTPIIIVTADSEDVVALDESPPVLVDGAAVIGSQRASDGPLRRHLSTVTLTVDLARLEERAP